MKTLFRPALCRAVLQITFVCLPFSLFAQSAANSGQIAGEVLDPSGASIPGVEVSVKKKDDARKMLNEVISEFPNSQSAEEARKLLPEL